MRINRQAKAITIRSHANTGTGVLVYLCARAGSVSAMVSAGINTERIVQSAGNAFLGYKSTAFITKPGPSLPTARDKSVTANEWVQRNLSKIMRHRGKWVAINNNGIVATSDGFDEVFSKARNRGVTNPLVFKVPRVPQGIKVVSGKLG